MSAGHRAIDFDAVWHIWALSAVAVSPHADTSSFVRVLLLLCMHFQHVVLGHMAHLLCHMTCLSLAAYVNMCALHFMLSCLIKPANVCAASHVHMCPSAASADGL